MSEQNNDSKWVQPDKISPFDTLIDRLENIRDFLEEERERLQSEIAKEEKGTDE